MSTGLDKALSEWWAATAPLTALVPAERVSSEIIQTNETTDGDSDGDGYFDDCVVFQIASEPHWRTNSGRGWKSQVKLSALSIDYDRSHAIAQAVHSAWDSGTFTGSGSAVTMARSTGMTPTQDADSGIWDHTISFDMNHNGI